MLEHPDDLEGGAEEAAGDLTDDDDLKKEGGRTVPEGAVKEVGVTEDKVEDANRRAQEEGDCVLTCARN